MDLTGLASKKNADEGVWVQAVVYGSKQDFDIKILGDDSEAVQRYSRQQVKRLKKTSLSVAELDDDTIDEILDSRDDAVIVRMAGLRSRDGEPLMLGGTELVCDEKSYRLLVEQIPDVKSFILEFSRTRKNFLLGRKES